MNISMLLSTLVFFYYYCYYSFHLFPFTLILRYSKIISLHIIHFYLPPTIIRETMNHNSENLSLFNANVLSLFSSNVRSTKYRYLCKNVVSGSADT